ncbi:MAG: hypothetical protein Q8R13_00630 [bacterium]|nr:hypothetical protein [bacterium]MDZ4296366.1 hypothetical protein [Patescibacteria group bacterium]
MARSTKASLVAVVVLLTVALAVVAFLGRLGPDLPFRLNYVAHSNHTISLVRPDTGQKEIILGFVMLPEACIRNAIAAAWQPGQWGRLSFGAGKCRVEPDKHWDPQEAAAHHARLKKHL